MSKERIVRETLENCDKLKSLLDSRNTVHGSYKECGSVYSEVFNALYTKLEQNSYLSENDKNDLTFYLTNVINKLSRLVTAEKVVGDNLVDIAGYSLLTLSVVSDNVKK